MFAFDRSRLQLCRRVDGSVIAIEKNPYGSRRGLFTFADA
jgi:hypothetical protein